MEQAFLESFLSLDHRHFDFIASKASPLLTTSGGTALVAVKISIIQGLARASTLFILLTTRMRRKMKLVATLVAFLDHETMCVVSGKMMIISYMLN